MTGITDVEHTEYRGDGWSLPSQSLGAPWYLAAAAATAIFSLGVFLLRQHSLLTGREAPLRIRLAGV